MNLSTTGKMATAMPVAFLERQLRNRTVTDAEMRTYVQNKSFTQDQNRTGIAF
jgi:hypothetical protein